MMIIMTMYYDVILNTSLYLQPCELNFKSSTKSNRLPFDLAPSSPTRISSHRPWLETQPIATWLLQLQFEIFGTVVVTPAR